ncbi:hypothetical protein PybrP1_004273 [[Pythium] brassicae (nom. inval.)]|nr:hypothetical protein PybrP1_004273 [[Pythium] brassicae (nom. inval.)]
MSAAAAIAADRQANERNDQFGRELSALQAKYHALEGERFQAADNATNATDKATAEPTQPTDDAHANDELVASLKEQLASLTAHRERLEEALRATHYDKISYTNALSNANAHNRALATDLARAEAKVLELTGSHSKLQQAVADATAARESQTRELEVLSASLQQSEDHRLLEAEKNASLHRELRAMDKVLAQRDDECRALNYSLLNQKAEAERLASQLDAVTSAQAADPDGGAGSAASRKAVLAHELKWLEDERKELREGKEQLVAQVLRLEEELQRATAAAQRSELDQAKLVQQLAVAATRQADLETMLDAKKRECLELETTLAAGKEQARELQGRLSQAQTLLQRADAAENEKIQVESEALGLRKLVEELRDRNASLTLRLENDGARARRLEEQAVGTQEQLALAQQAGSAREAELGALQRSYESVVSELRSARQLSSHYQGEYEKLAQELQSQHQSLSSGQSALQSSESSLSELRSQVRELQSALGLKQSAAHQLQTRLEQEKLGHRAAQSALALAQDEVLQLREAIRAREAATRQLRDELQAKDRALTEKSEAVANLQLLLEQMEASREQTLFKLKTQQQQLQRHGQETEDLHAKLAALDRDVQAKSAEVAALKKLTRTLDAERDRAHDQLDALTEKHHEVLEQNAQLRQGAQSETAAVGELQAQAASLAGQLTEREDDARRLQARCAQLETEVDRLEHVKGMHEAEMAALAQDLENMTVENQALSEECARAQGAHQSQSHSASGLRQALRQAERERDTLSVELEDLRHTYRSLVQEHDAVTRARAQVAELYDELAGGNDALREQVAKLEAELAVVQGKRSTLATEVATYREQVSFLTDKLQASEQALADRASRQHDLQHALETQRQVATEISAQRYGAQAQSAAVAQRIVHLEAKLSNGQFETRALQDKLHAEQAQRRALENLVASLREKVAANDTLIGHLEEQRQAMAHEIQSNHQRRRVGGNAMDVAELGAAGSVSRPLNGSQSALSSSHGSSPGAAHEVSPLSTSRTHSRANSASPPSGADRGLGNSAASSVSPLRSLEEAQRKCQELEDRLTQQDDTIKVRRERERESVCVWAALPVVATANWWPWLLVCVVCAQQLERSRSKFKRFAVKYEREIEQVRDGSRRIFESASVVYCVQMLVADARTLVVAQCYSATASSPNCGARTRRRSCRQRRRAWRTSSSAPDRLLRRRRPQRDGLDTSPQRRVRKKSQSHRSYVTESIRANSATV